MFIMNNRINVIAIRILKKGNIFLFNQTIMKLYIHSLTTIKFTKAKIQKDSETSTSISNMLQTAIRHD